MWAKKGGDEEWLEAHRAARAARRAGPGRQELVSAEEEPSGHRRGAGACGHFIGTVWGWALRTRLGTPSSGLMCVAPATAGVPAHL